jgi:hypothetical protein
MTAFFAASLGPYAFSFEFSRMVALGFDVPGMVSRVSGKYQRLTGRTAAAIALRCNQARRDRVVVMMMDLIVNVIKKLKAM